MTITSHHTPMLTIAVGAALLTAGCGIQGDDAEALTKPDFVAEANAICQTSNDRLDPIFEAVYADLDDVDWDDPDNQLLIFKRFDVALEQAVPIIDQQLDDVGALEPPADDKDLIETLLADQAAAVSEFTRLMNAAADGDQAALAALDTEEDPFDDIDRRAREYGLTVCGESD
jgi:hypothetical protein